MLKFKTFLILTIIVVFSFSLIGCGLLTSRSAEPVEEVSEGELPEWLLLAYRADDSDVAENAGPAGEVKEPPAPAETTQPAAATAQPASGSSAPATSAPASTTSSLENEIEERMNDILREIYADEIALEKKRLDKLAKEEAAAKVDEGRGFANWGRD